MIQEFLGKFRKKLVWIVPLIIVLSVANLLLTSGISKSYQAAVRGLFLSSDVASAIGMPKRSLLYSYGFIGSGTFNCSDFSFLVTGASGGGFVKIRVVQQNSAAALKVTTTLIGFGKSFSGRCTSERFNPVD